MKYFISVILLLAIYGCAAAPQLPARPADIVTVERSIDELWQATISLFAEKNIPILNMDRASGFIRSEEMAIGPADRIPTSDGKVLSAGDMADCGRELGFPHTGTGTTYISFTVLLQSVDEGTTKLTLNSAWRNIDPVSMGGPGVFSCVSKGVYELYVLAALLAK